MVTSEEFGLRTTQVRFNLTIGMALFTDELQSNSIEV